MKATIFVYKYLIQITLALAFLLTSAHADQHSRLKMAVVGLEHGHANG